VDYKCVWSCFFFTNDFKNVVLVDGMLIVQMVVN
jgi:hypothetical protein